MNIALGVPVGFLLSFIFIHRSWWKAGLVGFVFSSVIELSQLVSNVVSVNLMMYSIIR